MPTPTDTTRDNASDLLCQEPGGDGHGPLHPDWGLREKICAGDSRAQEELLVRRCGRILSYLASHYDHPDLTGEVFVHLSDENWRRLRTWEGRSALKTWVEQVAVRLCLKRLKERRRFKPLEEWDELETAMNRDKDHQEERFSRHDVVRAVAMLKSDQERRLLTLHALQGMSIAESARVLGITRGNADVIKHRAVRHLREALGLEGDLHG